MCILFKTKLLTRDGVLAEIKVIFIKFELFFCKLMQKHFLDQVSFLYNYSCYSIYINKQ